MVDSFCLLRSTNNKETSNQEKHHRVVLSRAAMKVLGKKIKYCSVSTSTKIRIRQNMVFPVTLLNFGVEKTPENSLVSKQNKPWIAIKIKWTIKQINPNYHLSNK